MPELDPQFLKFITLLKTQAATSADSLVNQSQPANENLGGSKAPPYFKKGTNDYNAADVHKYFNREGLYQYYIDSIEKDGQTKDIIAAKRQADFLAQLERDYKMYRLPRIRSVCFAASRRYGQGDDNGVINFGLKAEVEGWIQRDKKAQ